MCFLKCKLYSFDIIQYTYYQSYIVQLYTHDIFAIIILYHMYSGGILYMVIT